MKTIEVDLTSHNLQVEEEDLRVRMKGIIAYISVLF